MRLDEKKIFIDQYQIAYYDFNNDKKTTILFIHGNSSSKESFIPLFEKLENYRLIAFDFVGYGHSSDAEEGSFYNPITLCETIQKVSEAFSLENFILAGHSLGGHLSLQAIPLLKNKLRHVITWGTPPITGAVDFQKAFLPNLDVAPMFKPNGTLEELKTLARSYIFDKSFHESFINDYFNSDPQTRIHIFEAVAKGVGRDEIQTVKDSAVPITLIKMMQDTLVNPDYLTKTYEDIKNVNPLVDLKTIDSTHSAQIDNPELIADIINSKMKTKHKPQENEI